MPMSRCLRTTSATDAAKHCPYAASFFSPESRARLTAINSAGRGRLPTCVVRIRSLLDFTWFLPGASLFKPKSWLEAENAALRQQLIVLQRQVRGRVEFTNSDRLFFIQLYRWFPSVLKALTIMRPETVMRWHPCRFCRYWRCKSRNLGGRPKIAADLRTLIRQMSIENYTQAWVRGGAVDGGQLSRC